MPLKKYLNRVEQFDQLVRTKSTGPPEKAAQKLGMSRSSFHVFKNELIEDYGFPISYCFVRKTYFYSKPGRMVDLSFQKNTEK